MEFGHGYTSKPFQRPLRKLEAMRDDAGLWTIGVAMEVERSWICKKLYCSTKKGFGEKWFAGDTVSSGLKIKERFR